MRALIVFDDKECLEMTKLVVEGRFDAKIETRDSGDEALDLLTKDTDGFDLVICPYPKIGKTIINTVLSSGITLHFLCRNEAKIENDLFVSKRKQWVHTIDQISFYNELGIWIPRLFREYVIGGEPQGYAAVPLSVLLKANPLKSSVFLKLSSDKYVRVMREGFEFDRVDVDYYQNKKNVDRLWIRKSAFGPFFEQWTKNCASEYEEKSIDLIIEAKKKRIDFLVSRVKTLKVDRRSVNPAVVSKEDKSDLIAQKAKEIAKKISEQNKSKVVVSKVDPSMGVKNLEKELEETLATANKLGFTPAVQALTKQQVSKTIGSVRKAPRLSQLLAEVNKDPESYIPSHSMLLAFVSCAIATQMEWSSDTTYQKLSLASFLHDCYLKNNTLAKCQTISEIEAMKGQFTPEEIKAFKEHPLKGAEIARGFDEVPPDVDAIIMQHHERPDGMGFPRGMNHVRIGPLAMVFIVAHDFVNFLLSQPGDQQLNESLINKFISLHGPKYSVGAFKKVLYGLQKIKV